MNSGRAASKSKRYSAVKTRFLIADLVLTVVALVVFQAAISRTLSQAAVGMFNSFYLACFVYLAAFLAFMYIVTFPLNLAGSFFIERRFGLSNQNFFSWAADEIKSAALSFALWMLCIQSFYFVLRSFPHAWWVIISCLWVLFSIILSRLLPVLIIPIFFKYSSIEKGELKERIIKLAHKARISLVDVFQIDFSRKTKKANAALVGLGKTRKVILADTLVEEFTPAEAEAVVAHEFGHYKYKHIWQLLVFSGIITLCGFYLLSIMAERATVFAGASGLADLYFFPSLLLLMVFFSIIILPFQNLISRILERQADRYTLDLTGDAETFISVMSKLASMNLAETDPPLWKKIFLYDHPPIRERIKMAEEIKAKI